MAGETVVHMGENSPEYVAYQLLHIVAEAEKVSLSADENHDMPDRDWILSTYAQCLLAVRSPHAVKQPSGR